MKKLLLMAAFVLSTVGAFAQYEKGDFTIQPKVGLNVTSVSNFPVDKKWKAGFVGGVEAEYHFNHLLGLSFGALYSQQGTKLKLISNDNYADYTSAHFDYINIPVLANFYVVNGLAVKVGLQPGFKVRDAISYKGESMGWNKFCEATQFTGLKANTFDFSVPVGISYEYCNICLDARYNIGCTKVFGGDNRDYDKTSNNQVFQLTLGYKFKL